MGSRHPHMAPASRLFQGAMGLQWERERPQDPDTRGQREKLNVDIAVQTYLAPLNSWHERNFPNWFLSYQVFFFFNKLLLITCIPQNTTVTYPSTSPQ